MCNVAIARTVAAGAVALLAAAATTVTSGSATAHENLTVVSWGGAYTRSQMLAYIIPYRKETGTDVIVENYNGGLDQVREQVGSLNVKWDVVDLALADAIRGCREGLFEPLDPSFLEPAPDGTPAVDDFLPGTLTGCAVGQNVWATVIAYRGDRFADGQAPQSVADFFDVANFPGERGMRRTPRANLEWALLADGVPADDIYDVLSTPDGVDRAFRMLDRIKPYIVWWESGSEPTRLLDAGAVVMSSAYNGRIAGSDGGSGDQEPELTILWDGQVQAIELWGIVKGTWHLDLAKEFIRFATVPERLAEQARYIAYGPARKSAMALLDDETKSRLPTASANSKNVIKSDPEWWAEHQAELDRRFIQWLAVPAGTHGPSGTAM